MFRSTATSMILIGVLAVIVGILALAWPGITVLALVIMFAVLVLIVGIWAIAGGVAEFAAGFAARESAGTRALLLIAGLVSAAFGVVLLARPGIGAVTLALLYGFFALCYGVAQITGGIQLRHAKRDVATLLGRAAA